MKKLLIIRPVIPNDDFTIRFSDPACGSVTAEALAQGWQVTELRGNAANRANVQNSIQNDNPDLIIHYDHGGNDKLVGQKNNTREAVLDSSGQNPNVGLLTHAMVSTVSCSSAFSFGYHAINACTLNEKAYLGYRWPICCVFDYVDYFTRAANEANYALLQGETFGRAKERGDQQYDQELAALGQINDLYVKLFVRPIMWWDKTVFTLLGGPQAKP